MTSARKFRLRMTTRHTNYNVLCDLQCDFHMEKRTPYRGEAAIMRLEIEFGAEDKLACSKQRPFVKPHETPLLAGNVPIGYAMIAP